MMKVKRIQILKTVVKTRKKAPVFAQKIAKSVAVSSAAEVFLHHKLPSGNIIIDATFIEGLNTMIKIVLKLPIFGFF